MPGNHRPITDRPRFKKLIGRLTTVGFDDMASLDSKTVVQAIPRVLPILKDWNKQKESFLPFALWTPHVETPVLIKPLLDLIKNINAHVRTWWDHHVNHVDNEETAAALMIMWGQVMDQLGHVFEKNVQDCIRPLDWHQILITALSWLDEEKEGRAIVQLRDYAHDVTQLEASSQEKESNVRQLLNGGCLSLSSELFHGDVPDHGWASPLSRTHCHRRIDPTGMVPRRAINRGVCVWPRKPAGHEDLTGTGLHGVSLLPFDSLWADINIHLSHSIILENDFDKVWVMRCLQRCGINLLFLDEQHTMKTGSSEFCFIADEATFSIEGPLPDQIIMAHIHNELDESGISKTTEEKRLFCSAISRVLLQRRTLGYEVYGIGANNHGEVSGVSQFVRTNSPVFESKMIETVRKIATQMKDSAQTQMESTGAIKGELLASLQADDRLSENACRRLLHSALRLSVFAQLGPHPLTRRVDKTWEQVSRVRVLMTGQKSDSHLSDYKLDDKGVEMRQRDTGQLKSVPRTVPPGVSPMCAIYPFDEEEQSIPSWVTYLLRSVASWQEGAASLHSKEYAQAWVSDQRQHRATMSYRYNPKGPAIYETDSAETPQLDADGRPYSGIIPQNLWRT